MRLPRRLEHLIDRSYLLSTLQKRLTYHFAPAYRTNPLIVYQMGKVGSEALESSLMQYDLGRPLYRVHAMVAENIDEGLRAANTNRREYFYRSKTDFVGLHLGREIRRDLHKHQWQVVTMVREPVSQNVSSFFQILDLLIPAFERRLGADDIRPRELMDLFVRNYPPDNIFVHWFERELGRVFELDVYDHPFPFDAGFLRIRRPQIDLLIIRVEDLDRVASTAMAGFLGIDRFELRRKNEAVAKSYHRLYRQFQEEAVFPSEYLDAVYATPQARHFYSDEERAQFRARLNVAS